LLGLRVRGIEIADPGCVAKTFPEYFEVLETLRRQ
jgi:3-phosphoshikimate 1-carboxyvinyltransferase